MLDWKEFLFVVSYRKLQDYVFAKGECEGIMYYCEALRYM